MQPLSVAKILPGILFLLLAAFAPPPPCVAVTIEEIYDDDAGEGFLDGTDLTQAEKDFLATRGNNAETRGEARKNAFEHATSILESRLTNTNTIRISAKFVIFDGQEDSNDPDRCGTLTSRTYTIATTGPRGYGYPNGRFDEGDANNPGLGTAYPYALIEAILGKEFNGQEADIAVRFSKCIPFYYGFTESVPANQIDFIQISLHEITHGLGFLERVKENGDFPVRTISITGTQNGIPFTRSSSIKSRTIYDEQLYSETDDDLFIDLTNSERAAAIISEDGLLWEGLDGGRNPCSYGQRMAELKTSSAKSQDGKPRLHAPSPYDSGGSVSHLHENAGDLMEALYPTPRNMDLTLGMLKDMGWGVSANGFPSDCEPSGITVTPEAGLVTTEAGGEARFEVRLDSKPAENVTVSITSDNESEGVPDPNPLELTFTPSTWNTLQEVAIVGVDDGLQDGPQDYSVEIKADSDDRFYAVVRPKLVSLRNEDDDSLPQLFIIDYADAEEKDGVLDFVVDLSDTTAATVTVQYAITGVTAQEGTDYAAAPPNAAVTLAPGEKDTTISVPLIYDNLDEYPDVETLTVTLSNPQGATLTQNGSAATGTIRDSDQATLRIDNTSARENAGSMNFTVRLSPRSVRTVTTQYVITGNTAQEGSDYEAASATGTITFAPEQAQNTIGVSLVDDGDEETNEIFTVMLFNPQNAVLAQNGDTATGTIRDNDQPPPPPPPPNNQVTDNTQLPSGTPPAQEPAENPQKPQERPPATPQSGGGGCAIASGEGADHTVSTLLNLLPAVFAAFSLLSLKNRVTAG